jgi:hypothetical protein
MRRAYELASSARRLDYLTIEAALAGEYPGAREWLGRVSVRGTLL